MKLVMQAQAVTLVPIASYHIPAGLIAPVPGLPVVSFVNWDKDTERRSQCEVTLDCRFLY